MANGDVTSDNDGNAVVGGLFIVDNDGNGDDDDSNPKVESDPAVVYSRILKNLYLRDFLIGRGYPTVLLPQQLENADTDTELAVMTSSLDLNDSVGGTPPNALIPPRVKYLRDGDQAMLDRILAERTLKAALLGTWTTPSLVWSAYLVLLAPAKPTTWPSAP